MKCLKNNKGMTLVEISISFLLMTVVMIISMSILMFSNRMFVRSAIQNEIKMTGDEIFKTIENDIAYATNVEVRYNVSQTVVDIPNIINDAKYENIITVIDGDLYVGTKTAGLQNIYSVGTDENIYKDGDMKLSVAASSDQILNMTLDLEGAMESKYKATSAIKIISMRALPMEIRPQIEYVNLTSGTIPVISYGTGLASTEEMYMGGPYTIDQKYVPIDWSTVPVIDGEWPYNPVTHEPKFSEGDYVIYNGVLYRFSYPATDHSVPAIQRPGYYSWWITVDKDFDYSAVGNANSLYHKYDVINFELDNNYYMAYNDYTTSNFAPNLPALLGTTWSQTYWFSYKQEFPNNRQLGWSINPFDDSTSPSGIANYPDNNYKCASCVIDVTIANHPHHTPAPTPGP